MEEFLHQNLKDKLTADRLKRAKIRHRMDIITIIVIVVTLIVTGVLSLVLPKPTVSVSEKRDLTKMPKFSFSELFSGNYTRQTDLFYSDTFVARELLVNVSMQLSTLRGFRPGNITFYGSAIPTDDDNDTSVPAASSQPASSQPSSQPASSSGQVSSDVTPPAGDPNAQGEKVGALFLVGDTAYELFGGSKTQSLAYAATLSDFQKRLPEVTVYNLLVPTHVQINLPKQYRNLSHDERQYMTMIFDNLAPEIKRVDVYNTLMSHANEYLYFRTDHHWTINGAYYAYQEFCKTAGLKPIELKDCEKGTINGFLGTFYNSTKDQRLAGNPDTVDYYKIPVETTVVNTLQNGTSYNGKLIYTSSKGYDCFTGGDIPYIKITTGNKNGRKLFIEKESYGNAFVSLIAANYEEVYVGDLRTFPYNAVQFIKDNNIKEVLFLNNMFAATTKVQVENIQNMMNK